MGINKADLMKMSQVELDNLYKKSLADVIPDGDSNGTAIVGAGSLLEQPLSSLIKLMFWHGKVFHRDQGFLLNKITPFSLKLIKAEIYKGDSWIDGKEAIILDYSKTSFVAQKIRDEIRRVEPDLYLGYAFWEKTRVLEFILEF